MLTFNDAYGFHISGFTPVNFPNEFLMQKPFRALMMPIRIGNVISPLKPLLLCYLTAAMIKSITSLSL